MKYQFLYDVDFGYLRKYINSSLEKSQILKEINIKEKIINDFHYEFIWFIQDMSDEINLLLLDKIGIQILSKSERLSDKLNALITSNKKYVQELFNNQLFCEIINNNLSSLAYYFNYLNDLSINRFVNYLKQNDKMNLFYEKIYSNLSKKVQLNFITNNVIPFENLKSVMFKSNSDVCEYIIKHDFRIKSLEFSYNDIEKILSKKIDIYYLLKQTNILKQITHVLNPIYYRNLIKVLELSNGTEEIENDRKKYVDYIINTPTKEQIIKPLFKIYQNFNNKIDDIWKTSQPYIDMGYYNLLVTKIKETKNDKQTYIDESNYLLSLMIIDYHFKEYDLNVFIDIKQLLQFNKIIKNLNLESINFYNKILNIYNLSYREKIDLHEQLKKINIIEQFYDDIRKSKNIAYTMLKKQLLNEDNIKQLLNKEKSEEFGFDIYELNGEKFTALVKSDICDSLDINKSSGCFSIIGDNCLGTFKNPNEEVCIVYTDFNIDYLIHMFNSDSYSISVCDDSCIVTNRINLFMHPEEFKKITKIYNEVIFSYGKNLVGKFDSKNKAIIPKQLFILCYDEIEKMHKEAAKKFKLPILLINTESYKIFENEELDYLNLKEEFSYYIDINDVYENQKKLIRK